MSAKQATKLSIAENIVAMSPAQRLRYAADLLDASETENRHAIARELRKLSLLLVQLVATELGLVAVRE
jgi:hypothetical protein